MSVKLTVNGMRIASNGSRSVVSTISSDELSEINKRFRCLDDALDYIATEIAPGEDLRISKVNRKISERFVESGDVTCVGEFVIRSRLRFLHISTRRRRNGS